MKKQFFNFNNNELGDFFKKVFDIYIILDFEGTVHELNFSGNPTKNTIFSKYKNKKIFNFLTEESVPKVKKNLKNIFENKKSISNSIEINHLHNNRKEDFPVSYKFQRINDNFFMMVGKDLQEIANLQRKLVDSQILLEKEYDKYKEFDTKYRILMERADEAFITFKKENGTIIDINNTAKNVLKIEKRKKIKLNFFKIFKNKKNKNIKDEIIDCAKNSCELYLKTKNNNKKFMLKPSLFRSGNDLIVFCKLSLRKNINKISTKFSDLIKKLYDSCPDGILFITEKGVITEANKSFLEMCNITTLNDLIGNNLSDYFENGITDLKIILEETTKNKRIKKYPTNLITSQGMSFSASVATCLIQNPKRKIIGMTIRLETNFEEQEENKNSDNLMRLVGSAPLKALVAESSDVVEKICIETALKITKNNRVAAADLLEISRQSLYVKLEKYNLMEKSKNNNLN